MSKKNKKSSVVHTKSTAKLQETVDKELQLPDPENSEKVLSENIVVAEQLHEDK